MKRFLQPNMLFCNIWLVFSLVNSWIVLVPCFHPCSRGEKEKDRKREEMEQEGREMSLCNYPDFLGKPTQSEASISLAGQRTGGFFLSQLYLSLFILHTCSLKCCQSASETGSNTSSEYFYVSFIERVFDVLLSRYK